MTIREITLTDEFKTALRADLKTLLATRPRLNRRWLRYKEFTDDDALVAAYQLVIAKELNSSRYPSLIRALIQLAGDSAVRKTYEKLKENEYKTNLE